jgi:hypothetical protein
VSFRERYRRFCDAESRGFAGPGEFFDATTFRGLLRFFVTACAATYVLWHSYELAAWFRETILSWSPVEIDLAKQSWARLWAVIIGGTAMLVSIIAMIMIPINRRRARKSTKGQWHNDPSLSKRDLDVNDKAKPGGAE